MFNHKELERIKINENLFVYFDDDKKEFIINEFHEFGHIQNSITISLVESLFLVDFLEGCHFNLKNDKKKEDK